MCLTPTQSGQVLREEQTHTLSSQIANIQEFSELKQTQYLWTFELQKIIIFLR